MEYECSYHHNGEEWFYTNKLILWSLKLLNGQILTFETETDLINYIFEVSS